MLVDLYCKQTTVKISGFSFHIAVLNLCSHGSNLTNPLCVYAFMYVQIRRQAIKELPRFATGENTLRVADILTQLLQTGIGGL